MRRFACLTLGVLALTPLEAGYATAEADPDVPSASEADVQCVVVAANMMNSADGQLRSAAATVFYYFLGRLDGRDPTMDLQSALVAEIHRTEGKSLSAEAKRCGQVLQKRGAEVQAMGQRIQSQGEQKKPAAPQ